MQELAKATESNNAKQTKSSRFLLSIDSLMLEAHKNTSNIFFLKVTLPRQSWVTPD